MKNFWYKFQLVKKFILITIFLFIISLVPQMVREILATDLTRIQILQKAEIDDENILLGQIAKIDGHDPLLVKKLHDIVVARAPLPGKSRELKKKLFRTRLRQNGIDLARIILHIPAKVVVSRSFITISREEIKMLVSDYIAKNLSTENGDVDIKDIQVSENMRLPGGRVTYKVLPPRNRDLMGKIPFSIYFNVNGEFYKRVRATATVKVFAEVVVTRKPLARHKPITEDDIELIKMDLANLPSSVITDQEDILGKRTKRAIGAKTVLRPDLVEFPPLVKRGDVVIIIAESNGLKISTLGQVKKKGRLGERIPVINFDSKKILYARVLDSGTVKVDF